MKFINRIQIMIFMLIGVTACAGKIVHLENAQGARITCEVSTASAMMTGVLVRDGSIYNCVRDKEAAGFKVVGEE